MNQPPDKLGCPPAATTRADAPLADVYARRGLLVRLAYRFLWNHADAEDAVQNALLLAQTRHDQLADPRRLWGWLRTIVVRQCHELLRTRQRHERQADALRERQRGDGAAASASDSIAEREFDALVRRHIAQLPERQQTALVLRHLEDMGYAEIAEIMGISESTARVHVRDAREALRRAIERAAGQ